MLIKGILDNNIAQISGGAISCVIAVILWVIVIYFFKKQSKKDQKPKRSLTPEEQKQRNLAFIKRHSNGKIYFDIGKIEITDDNIDLLKYWGGETLYSYYTNPYDIREEFEVLKNKLLEHTYPCIVVLSTQAYKFFNEFYDNLSILNGIKSNRIMNYENEHCTNKVNIKVVNVISINID